MKKILFPLALVVAGAVIFLLSLFTGGGQGNLKIKLTPANYIMPAAYKLYSTPEVLGGRLYLFKAILKNEGNKSIKNLKVEYRVPKYIDTWTPVDAPPILLSGQTMVCMAYPAFDKNITEKNSQSKERVEIRITYGSKEHPQEINEWFPFTMLAVNDFAYTDMPRSELISYTDIFDNLPLCPCFITSEDPVIQYYTSKIKQVILQGEEAGVNPTPEECVRFLLGIYNATLSSGMVYSSTSGMPANIGSASTLIQRIRLPREVITGNTGLCIELTFLYAAILRNAGMEPILFSVPGHIYPGFRINNQYYAIEATGVSGAGLGGIASAEQAFETGMKQLKQFFEAQAAGDDRYIMVDVNALISEGIVPMELKDDAFGKQKVDEYSAMWTQGGVTVAATPNNTANATHTASTTTSGGGGGGNSNTSVSSGMKTFSRSITFSYPSGWNVLSNPYPQEMPALTAMIVSPNQNQAIEVYSIQGTNDIGTGINYLIQIYQSMGMNISYQFNGQKNGFTIISGNTSGAGWYGAFRTRNNSVEGVIFPNSIQNVQQMLASVR